MQGILLQFIILQHIHYLEVRHAIQYFLLVIMVCIRFIGVPILTPPDQHLSENAFYDNFRIVVLILASLLLPTFVIVGLFWRKSIIKRFKILFYFKKCCIIFRNETRTRTPPSLDRRIPFNGPNAKQTESGSAVFGC